MSLIPQFEWPMFYLKKINVLFYVYWVRQKLNTATILLLQSDTTTAT